ncbi:hypothetical protein OXB_1902 [Bacillus sp. OxB-1]|uniref:YkyA family protein n=1 Tax=Bacillus sp. (strain OxB-1) TaxID=98228 RepID=UPI000582384E|nr:YkyA family protein [Bacillus sp. OxB-1]BAQ10373.1 hypothetical protein OXB_1902 [Bacillus sp. OxB-1]
MRNSVLGLFIGWTLLLLVGCSFDPSPEERLAETLSKMNEAERDYRDAQVELAEIEKSEQQLFLETMKLSREQDDELKVNAARLVERQSKRLDILEVEKKSMEKARRLSDEFAAITEKAEDSVKKDVESLRQAIDGRYDRHDAFLASYNELAALQKGLYEMLTTEGTDFKKLDEHVRLVNEQNEKVQSAVESFNESTREVNELRGTVESRLQLIE